MAKDGFDVVIVGAGCAGIECAEQFGGSKLRVLLIERNNFVGRKTCANGVMLEDLKYIPKKLLNSKFKGVVLHRNNTKIVFDEAIISSINREQWLTEKLKKLKKFKNINVLQGVSVSKILSDSSLELSSGKQIKFKFLVGAEGVNSVVRNYLKIPNEKLIIAMHYKVPKQFDDFEFIFDEKKYGLRYFWIFPHKNYDSVGCGVESKSGKAGDLKEHLDAWLKEHNIDSSKLKLEAAPINYDYRGYRFGNIFLAGDAAGLTSGLTGKGIYSALLSGEQIANEILQKKTDRNLIEEWLARKEKQEHWLNMAKNSFFRNIMIFLGTKLLRFKSVQKTLIKQFA